MKSLIHISVVLTVFSGLAAAQEMPFTAQLTTPLSTATNHKGDAISATVLQPDAFRGDIIQGHVTESKSGNKLHGEAVLNFNFDTLQHDGTAVPIASSINSISNSKGQANVDEEGRVIRKSSNLGKAAAGTGAGALIGGLTHGIKGAAVGAAVGAAASVILIEVAAQGPKVEFAPGSQMSLSVKSRGGPELASLKPNAGPPAVTAAAPPTVSAPSSAAPAVAPNGGATPAPAASEAAAPTIYKTYQNYDFVPGDKIVFEDDFRSDQDGEFPAHWKLIAGQGVVNNMEGAPAFALTEGNYARVAPRMSTDAYLENPFTIEFDYYPQKGGYEKLIVFLKDPNKESDVSFGAEVATAYFEVGNSLSGHYPGAGDFMNKWHHAALAFKDGQIKCYEDQYRVLVVPDVGKFKPVSVSFGGIADPQHPLLFKNVRIANGGGMTMIEKLTKEGRIVTHGIQFDVNQAVVKPESMGTIRQIVAMLKADNSLKLEIGGHTDSDGDAAKNLSLSEARAEAVKKILVDQGIDAARLTTKGYGATKPIAPNTTPEGKANNRRVEFVKQ